MASTIENPPQAQLKALESKYRKRNESRNEFFSSLAAKLGRSIQPPRLWTNKRLYAVLRGEAPGQDLAEAIARLYNLHVLNAPTPRRRWRLHVQFESREEWELVRRMLSGEERRELLVWHAQQENFEEVSPDAVRSH